MPEPKQGPAPAAPAAEPLSAILAEMRRHADQIGPTAAIALCDRIEAAAERERDEARRLDAIRESDEAFARCARCDRPERSGNAAAMREALDILEKLDYAIPYVYQRQSPQNEIARLVRLAENKIRTALETKGE